MKLVGITIPIYKDFKDLKKSEILSLIQCTKILNSYPIYFICPNGLNIEEYKKKCMESEVAVKFKYFDEEYFNNLNGYNKLLTSIKFFESFSEFKYILIYQLDAWVFKDELKYWCNRKFDYIGAPWFEGWGNAKKKSNIIGVGNGGFSLRNIQTGINITKKLIFLKRLKIFWFRSKFQAFVNFDKIINLLRKKLKIVGNTTSLNLLFEQDFQEDIFWTKVVSSNFTNYSVAPINDAIRFSFEVNPSLLYEMNKQQLPFGCHAWEKYEPAFWEKFIDENIFLSPLSNTEEPNKSIKKL